MEDLIARLDHWLRENCPDDYPHLLSGLTEAELQELEEKLALPLPEDFKTFYRWKNGQGRGFSRRFTDNFDLMTAKDIVYSAEIMNELLEGGDFEQANWWNKKWVPFMENGGGDHYCLDLDGSFEGRPGQIIEFWHDAEARTIKHESFYKWLETLVKALERGVLVYDLRWKSYQPARGYDELFNEINPGYPIGYEAG